MSLLPDSLKETLESRLGTRFREAEPLSGGMINKAARVETADGEIFLKWSGNSPDGFYAREAEALLQIAATQTLRTPGVLALADRETPDRPKNCPCYLALEYFRPEVPADHEKFVRSFASGLAALHASPTAQTFGLETDNFIGTLLQRNLPTESWTEFYRDQRIIPQMEIARSLGRLPAYREQCLYEVLDKLELLMEGLDSQSSIIHGDLWSGNFLCFQGSPVVFDPALYRAVREMEIAYIELFGGFPEGFLSVYEEYAPLPKDYSRRRKAHQLYPLLVHLNHFGESYGLDIDMSCRQILAHFQ